MEKSTTMQVEATRPWQFCHVVVMPSFTHSITNLLCLIFPVSLWFIISIVLCLSDGLLTLFDNSKVLLLQLTCSLVCLSLCCLESVF